MYVGRGEKILPGGANTPLIQGKGGLPLKTICHLKCKNYQQKYENSINFQISTHHGLNSSLYFRLAWEPSAAQVNHSYSRQLPALERFYRETKFLLLKSTNLT